MYRFSFSNPVKTYVGEGCCRDLASLARGNRIMLISDETVAAQDFYPQIRQSVADRLVCEYFGIRPNPECEQVDGGAKLAREHEVDCIIGLGGGSVMDAAKAVAGLAYAQGNCSEYVDGTRKFGTRRPYLVLCATTSGTGSEVTNVSVVTNRALRKKVPLVDNLLYADVGIVDSRLTGTMPRELAALTGFDAFCHAIECYWNTGATPPSDGMALWAMRSIIQNLEAAYGGSAEAKEEMAVASHVAGLAFSQTRTTVCHAISYDLTAGFGIPHGTACTFTLVPFMRYNYETMKQKLDAAGKFCGFDDFTGLIFEIERLYSALNMPGHLAEFGVKPADLEAIAKAGMALGSTKLNGREVSYEAMYAILEQIL